MRSIRLIKEDHAFFRRIDARTRKHLKCRDAVGSESGIDTLDQHEAADEEPRPDGEHHSRRYFHDHKYAAHSSPRIPAAFFQRGRRRRPRKLDRRCEPGDDRRQNNHSAYDDGCACVNRNVIDAGDVERSQSGDYIQRPPGERQPRNAAGSC